MAINLSKEIIDAIKNTDSVKVLASISKENVPHVTVKNSLNVLPDGTLFYYELLETSQTQKNLVNSIWFHKQIAINIITPDEKSYQIKGTPKKAVIAGQLFLEAYEQLQLILGKDTDLSTIWLIDVEEFQEETFSIRKEIEEKLHPYELHVDRLAK